VTRAVVTLVGPDVPGFDCSVCGYLACVCEVLAAHKNGCRFRLAATCAIPVECDHGLDVCPTCDPCTCGAAS
jgi:hypothetical protein